jgi:hypothetical protein
VDVVKGITKFYYRKGADYRCGLCQVEWRSLIQEKSENFILGCFYIILNLKKSLLTPTCNGLQARGSCWVGGLMHKPMLILSYPKSMQRKFPL